MSMIEKMIETKAWKKVRRLTKNSLCRLGKEQQETFDWMRNVSKQ